MLPISRDSSGVLGLVEVDVLQALHHTFLPKIDLVNTIALDKRPRAS